jgi:DinB superfamily
MDTKKVIQAQFLAALEMLKQAVVKCPDSLWNAAEDRNKFWHIAYHALFYTHLYLQDSEKDFKPWENHRDEYQFMGQVPWPPHTPPKIGEPYTREEMLAYLAFVRKQVQERVPALNLEAASGFDWQPFGKLELQFYNIRHLQQHAGELYERLGARAVIDLDWIGSAA